MNVDLSGLAAGQWRHLSDKEMRAINQATEASSKTQEASAGAGSPKRDAKPASASSAVSDHKTKPAKKGSTGRHTKPATQTQRNKTKRVKGTLSLKK